MQFRIGVDIGGTTMSAGIVDETGTIIAKAGTATKSGRGPEAVIKRLTDMLCGLLMENGVERGQIRHIGIGCPGEIDRDSGVVLYSNNIGWNGVPLREEIEKIMELPVFIENDAGCAAFGEYMAGAGRGSRSMVMATLGTGIGGGIIVNGRIFTGKNGNAGIIGHMILQEGGLRCNCGRRGCWEAYASVGALTAMAERQTREDRDSQLTAILSDRGFLDGKAVLEAVHKKDRAATVVWNRYLQHVAEGVVNLINILDPEVVVLGGGISGQGTLLVEPVRRFAAEKRYCRHGALADITASRLGNDAAIIGAAHLGTQNF